MSFYIFSFSQIKTIINILPRRYDADVILLMINLFSNFLIVNVNYCVVQKRGERGGGGLPYQNYVGANINNLRARCQF